MMITSSTITRNAHSGAAGKTRICSIAFRPTRNTAVQRAHGGPPARGDADQHQDDARIIVTQPQAVRSAMIAP